LTKDFSEAKIQLKNEPILLTDSFASLTSKPSSDYVIPLKNSRFHTIILHLTQARVYLKNQENFFDTNQNLLPIPPTYANRKMIRFQIDQLQNYDEIFIRLDNSKSQVNVYQISKSEQSVDLPTFGSRTFTFSQTSYEKLVFPTLDTLWQVYQLTLISSDSRQTPFIHFHVPWSNEDLYNLVSLRNPSSPSTVLSQTLQRAIRLKLHRLSSTGSSSIEFYLQPNSTYTFQIHSSFLDILAQLARYYIFLLPTFLFTVLCVSYSIQINNPNLRTYQTMLAWQIHLPMALFITILYRLVIFLFPSMSFVVNLHSNGYYFFILPFILYGLAMSLWACLSFIIDYILFDSIQRLIYPIFIAIQNELYYQQKLFNSIQLLGLLIPLLATVFFSGSNGHIALFLIALVHIIWRRTINRRLQEILTTLLLFHGLLVCLHLTGFILHIKSLLVEGFYPLYMLTWDCSLPSAFISILAFYLRFQSKYFSQLQTFAFRYNQLFLFILSLSAQFFCSYSMYLLWIYICVIFMHVALIYFLPKQQDKKQ